MGQDRQLRGIIVAIDGTSASGKTTLARKLAAVFHCRYLLTGNLYRVLAKKLLEKQGIDQMSPEFVRIVAECVDRIVEQDLEDSTLGSDEVSLHASMIATNKMVREKLNFFQREWIKKQKDGAVVEGRDIGTVIWPQAEVKIFVTASIETRARRRFDELKLQNSSNSSFESVLEDLRARDRRDTEREFAPLSIASDASVLDSSNISADEIMNQALKIIEKRIDIHTDKV